MNERHVRQLSPSFRKIKRKLNAAEIRLDYNEYSDTMFVYLFPGDQPLVSVPDEDGLTSLLVEPESEEVHGFQIDDFLERAAIEHPNLLDMAPLAGIDPARTKRARQKIGETRMREAVISAAIEELFSDSELNSLR